MKRNDKAQHSTHSMPSQVECYYGNCVVTPKWGVMSSVKHRNPDGSALTLYTCDSHYSDLTGDLKKAGTRYALFPVSESPVVSPRDVVEVVKINPKVELPDPEDKLPVIPETPFIKFFFNIMVITFSTIIAPFVIVYYGGKWVLGWRPPSGDQ